MQDPPHNFPNLSQDEEQPPIVQVIRWDNSIYDKLNTYSKSNDCLLGHTVQAFYIDK